MTHRFHPLRGAEFALVTAKATWGLDRVYYHDAEGTLVSMPRAWTSVRPCDPFVEVSAGRSPFRIQDLLELAALLRVLVRGEADRDGHV